MKLTNYILASILSIIVLSSTMGIKVIERICDTCQTEESFIELYSQSTEKHCTHNNFCCESESNCCTKEETHSNENIENKCCSTNETFLKIDDAVTLTQNITLNINFILYFVEIEIFNSTLGEINLNNKIISAKLEIPPDNKQLLNCIFRI